MSQPRHTEHERLYERSPRSKFVAVYGEFIGWFAIGIFLGGALALTAWLEARDVVSWWMLIGFVGCTTMMALPHGFSRAKSNSSVFKSGTAEINGIVSYRKLSDTRVWSTPEAENVAGYGFLVVESMWFERAGSVDETINPGDSVRITYYLKPLNDDQLGHDVRTDLDRVSAGPVWKIHAIDRLP